MSINSNDSNKILPEGHHYMPNGTLMENSEMTTAKTYTYKDYTPLITIIGFVFSLSLILTSFFSSNSSQMLMSDGMAMGMQNSQNSIMIFMDNLMGIWFLIFALFKLIDLKGFAEGYSSYDIIAKRFNLWGYIYPFIEIALGTMYLIKFNPVLTNSITLVVLATASIGIIQNMLKKSKIQCSCLGTVLKVPLTKVTLVENLVMAVMALFMLVVMR